MPRDVIQAGTSLAGGLSKDAPIGARCAKAIAERLQTAMSGRTKSGLAQEIGIARSTLHDVLKAFVARPAAHASLEEALEPSLWPAQRPKPRHR